MFSFDFSGLGDSIYPNMHNKPSKLLISQHVISSCHTQPTLHVLGTCSLLLKRRVFLHNLEKVVSKGVFSFFLSSLHHLFIVPSGSQEAGAYLQWSLGTKQREFRTGHLSIKGYYGDRTKQRMIQALIHT